VFSHAYECYLCADREECVAYHEAAKEAQAAQDAADLEAGRALRRLVGSGMVFAVSHTARGWVLMDYGTAATVTLPTLAAAVTAALEG
jgi:hypothetical protein